MLLVVFWPGLPKTYSILFEILTSDSMQDDASESCFVYALLHPMSCATWFYQIKDLNKIKIFAKFHQHSNCGCEVQNFQHFSY